MTNYLTSVGVQNFSITIASGSTTGTASVNAVGSGAFILLNGINPSVSSNPSEVFSYLSLTNSTTITATRHNGASGTVVINGCIIDADTTNLVKSVQYGVINISNTTSSGTASISAVTNANTATHLLGWNTANTTYSDVNENPVLSLSGTTVTASRIGTDGNIAVGFVVIEFQSSCLNQSVQNISVTSSASVTSYTGSLSSVVVNNTLCIYGGARTSSGSGGAATAKQYSSLTSSTVITINIHTATTKTKVYNCSVVEFASGVLNSSIKRGTTSLASVNSNTSTIASVSLPQSATSWLGNTTSESLVSLQTTEGAAVLSNSTTVTVERNSSSSDTIVGSWEIAEFTASISSTSGDAIWFGMTV